jgi:hypothetical protein
MSACWRTTSFPELRLGLALLQDHMIVVLQLDSDRLSGILITGGRHVTKSVAIIIAFQPLTAGGYDFWTVDGEMPGAKAPIAVNRIGKRTGNR